MRKIHLLVIGLAFLLTASPLWGNDYNIRDFGAVSDTSVLSTTALQAAIDRCAKEGGGRVVVPTGSYKIGSVVLRSDVHLYLENGATLYGSTSLADYKPMRSSYVSLRTQTQTV